MDEEDPYADVRARNIDLDRRERSQAGHGRPEPTWSPDAALMDTVARLQLDLDEMRAESRHLRQLRCRSLLA